METECEARRRRAEREAEAKKTLKASGGGTESPLGDKNTQGVSLNPSRHQSSPKPKQQQQHSTSRSDNQARRRTSESESVSGGEGEKQTALEKSPREGICRVPSDEPLPLNAEQNNSLLAMAVGEHRKRNLNFNPDTRLGMLVDDRRESQEVDSTMQNASRLNDLATCKTNLPDSEHHYHQQHHHQHHQQHQHQQQHQQQQPVLQNNLGIEQQETLREQQPQKLPDSEHQQQRRQRQHQQQPGPHNDLETKQQETLQEQQRQKLRDLEQQPGAHKHREIEQEIIQERQKLRDFAQWQQPEEHPMETKLKKIVQNKVQKLALWEKELQQVELELLALEQLKQQQQPQWHLEIEQQVMLQKQLQQKLQDLKLGQALQERQLDLLLWRISPKEEQQQLLCDLKRRQHQVMARVKAILSTHQQQQALLVEEQYQANFQLLKLEQQPTSQCHREIERQEILREQQRQKLQDLRRQENEQSHQLEFLVQEIVQEQQQGEQKQPEQQRQCVSPFEYQQWHVAAFGVQQPGQRQHNLLLDSQLQDVLLSHKCERFRMENDRRLKELQLLELERRHPEPQYKLELQVQLNMQDILEHELRVIEHAQAQHPHQLERNLCELVRTYQELQKQADTEEQPLDIEVLEHLDEPQKWNSWLSEQRQQEPQSQPKLLVPAKCEQRQQNEEQVGKKKHIPSSNNQRTVLHEFLDKMAPSDQLPMLTARKPTAKYSLTGIRHLLEMTIYPLSIQRRAQLPTSQGTTAAKADETGGQNTRHQLPTSGSSFPSPAGTLPVTHLLDSVPSPEQAQTSQGRESTLQHTGPVQPLPSLVAEGETISLSTDEMQDEDNSTAACAVVDGTSQKGRGGVLRWMKKSVSKFKRGRRRSSSPSYSSPLSISASTGDGTTQDQAENPDIDQSQVADSLGTTVRNPQRRGNFQRLPELMETPQSDLSQLGFEGYSRQQPAQLNSAAKQYNTGLDRGAASFYTESQAGTEQRDQSVFNTRAVCSPRQNAVQRSRAEPVQPPTQPAVQHQEVCVPGPMPRLIPLERQQSAVATHMESSLNPSILDSYPDLVPSQPPPLMYPLSAAHPSVHGSNQQPGTGFYDGHGMGTAAGAPRPLAFIDLTVTSSASNHQLAYPQSHGMGVGHGPDVVYSLPGQYPGGDMSMTSAMQQPPVYHHEVAAGRHDPAPIPSYEGHEQQGNTALGGVGPFLDFQARHQQQLAISDRMPCLLSQMVGIVNEPCNYQTARSPITSQPSQYRTVDEGFTEFAKAYGVSSYIPASCPGLSNPALRQCCCRGDDKAFIGLEEATNAVAMHIFAFYSHLTTFEHPAMCKPWIHNVDRLLGQGRWQWMDSIDAAVLMHTYIVLKQFIKDKNADNEDDCFNVVRASLYLAMSYSAREITYPVRAYTDPDYSNKVLDFAVPMMLKTSHDMLLVNSCPGFRKALSDEMKTAAKLYATVKELFSTDRRLKVSYDTLHPEDGNYKFCLKYDFK